MSVKSRIALPTIVITKNAANDPCPCGHHRTYQRHCGEAGPYRVGSRPRRAMVRAAALVTLGFVSLLGVSCGWSEDPRADAERRAQELLAERTTLDETVWAEEQLAQQYEATFVSLWDSLREAQDKSSVLAGFELREIAIGEPSPPRELIDGIFATDLNASPQTLTQPEWVGLLDRLQDQGFTLVQSEWHHASFDTDASGHRVSTFNIVLHVTAADPVARYEITGPIQVVWADEQDASGRFVPASIDATGLSVIWRHGQPIFDATEVASFALPGRDSMRVVAHDLDGDQLTDLVYPAQNAVLWNRGDGRFEQAELLDHPVPDLYKGVFADFTGDGRFDFLVAAGLAGTDPPRWALFLYEQDASQRFSTPPSTVVDPETVTLRVPSSYAVGDVDGDNDLDVYLGQYKNPYTDGQFPDPYYDANDGHPAYLLLNQGNGQLEDATEQAGLTAKRYRRTYRSSFVDLDDDHDLDLLVVNDFAGIDLYFNDGEGHFTDVTQSAVDVAENFGMSHTFADFNSDGRLDFYVTGMSSTTARRLEQMGLVRADMPEHTRKRMDMAYGNRMYLAEETPGQYRQPPFRDRVARSGWTWGVAAADVNNDGYPDIYAANGHLSGESVKDYCSRFWTHDIYSGSQEDLAKMLLFTVEGEAREGMSWNGFEHNHLFLNLTGQDFTNVAFLMGVAMEQDSRVVIADDFDADGRIDLLVSSTGLPPFADDLLTLHLLRNRGEFDRHWIGVRLRGAPGVSPLGARITVVYADGRQTAVIVTGDSFMAQHPLVKHFGLGQRDAIEFLEVHWPNGEVTRLNQPAIDQYHTLSP